MVDEPPLNPYLPPGENLTKHPAPGAKTARVCGITAIICALTCVGIPIAIVLGIVAVVQASKAKALARSYPETYEVPSAAGMILGIVGICMPVVMLPFAGIVSAIAVPAILGQRARARDKVLMVQWVQVRTQAETIAMESRASGERPLTGDEAIRRLMEDPSLKALKNSHSPGLPVLIRAAEPLPGTIALSPDREEETEGTRFSVILRARFGSTNATTLREEKVEAGFQPR